MSGCTLCPRACGAARGEAQGGGVCGMGMLPRVARAALHRWEEPCISGARGSGAVFFSGCALRCAFCQNEAISHGGAGETISVRRLADVFRELEEQGAHNINLVTAAHFVPAVLDRSLLSRVQTVENDAAFTMMHLLAETEGVFCGISSGAAVSAAADVLREDAMRGKTVVAILPDTGERYLSCL